MKQQKYFNVVKLESGEAAELLIYGYIGQQAYWEEDKDKEITDLAVVKALNELEKEYNRINIRINSPGGSVYHGDAIIAAIRRSPAEIHTYNDGLAASMGAQIWFASKRRHMAKNAKLMIHPTLSGVIGNAKIFREEAEVLDKYDQALACMIAENCSMSEEEVMARYIEEYKDNFLTHRDALDAGFITEPDEYEAENVISNVENMAYSELIAHFGAIPAHTEKASFLKELKDTIVGTFRQMAPDRQTIQLQKSQIMNKQQLIDSLKSGEIKPEEAAEALRQHNYTAEPVKAPETPDVASVVSTAIAAALKPLQEQIASLQGQVNQIGGQPGDTRSGASAPADPDAGLTTEQKEAKKNLEALNAQFAAAGKNRERLEFR